MAVDHAVRIGRGMAKQPRHTSAGDQAFRAARCLMAKEGAEGTLAAVRAGPWLRPVEYHIPALHVLEAIHRSRHVEQKAAARPSVLGDGDKHAAVAETADSEGFPGSGRCDGCCRRRPCRGSGPLGSCRRRNCVSRRRRGPCPRMDRLHRPGGLLGARRLRRGFGFAPWRTPSYPDVDAQPLKVRLAGRNHEGIVPHAAAEPVCEAAHAPPTAARGWAYCAFDAIECRSQASAGALVRGRCFGNACLPPVPS